MLNAVRSKTYFWGWEKLQQKKKKKFCLYMIREQGNFFSSFLLSLSLPPSLPLFLPSLSSSLLYSFVLPSFQNSTFPKYGSRNWNGSNWGRQGWGGKHNQKIKSQQGPNNLEHLHFLRYSCELMGRGSENAFIPKKGRPFIFLSWHEQESSLCKPIFEFEADNVPCIYFSPQHVLNEDKSCE